MRAVPPAGGCTQFPSFIANTDAAAATGRASRGDPPKGGARSCTEAMPHAAEARCPAMTFHGCEKGA
jgi:hypothetical protein